MKAAKIVGIVILWFAVMSLFLAFITLAGPNRFALQPDWFHGNKNCIDATCSVSTLVGYSSRGFPIIIPGEAVTGSFALANIINLVFAAAAGGLFALLLVKKRKYGVILGLIFIFLIVLFNFII